MLDHYQVKTPTLSYHQHSKLQKIDYILSLLKQGKIFEEMANSKYPVIFYKSPYRILKTLNELKDFLTTNQKLQNTQIVVCRELTKKLETINRGSMEEVVREIEKDMIKGEFVVIV